MLPLFQGLSTVTTLRQASLTDQPGDQLVSSLPLLYTVPFLTPPLLSSPLFYTYSCLVGAKCSPVSEQCGWCTCSDALQPGQHLLSAEGGGESQEGAAAGSWLVLMAGVPLNSLIAYLQAATLFGEIPSQVVLLSAYIELMSGEHTGW